ncbi:hypothetical protein [Bradyrhizobium sp. USDA 4508]
MPKKPADQVRSEKMHVKVRPHIKTLAEGMAADDQRSVAQWLELLIEAEHERRQAAKSPAR